MKNKIYVVSIFWRDCDTLYTVAGFDKKHVQNRVDELVDETIRDMFDTMDEDRTYDEIADELRSTGLNTFNWPADELGIPEESVEELVQDGITVY